MSRNRVVKPVRFLWSLSALLALLMAVGNAQGHVSLGITYNLPTEELELDAKGLERVLSAKTVMVMAASVPFIVKGDRGAGKLTYYSGRVGPDKAKAEVVRVLSEWGAFSLIENPLLADLVVVIEEHTLGEGNTRLRDTLAVFPTGGPGLVPPLWVGIETQGRRADAKGVTERFRRDVENATKRVKK